MKWDKDIGDDEEDFEDMDDDDKGAFEKMRVVSGSYATLVCLVGQSGL